MNVILIPREGASYKVEVPRAALAVSGLITDMLLDDEDAREMAEIPLPNVGKEALAKVLEWCMRELESPMQVIEKPVRSKSMVTNVGPWQCVDVA